MNRALFALLLAASLGAMAQESKAKAAPAAAAAKSADPKAAAASTAIVANKESRTYHRADCRVAARMKAANRTPFATAADAHKAGFKACKVCKP